MFSLQYNLYLIKLRLNAWEVVVLSRPLLVYYSDSPLLAIKTDAEGKIENVSIDEARARQLANLEKVIAALEQMHREVFESTSKAREQSVKSHNARTNVRAYNLHVGDFVLRGVLQNKKGSKLSLRWKGPFQVTRVMSDFLFEVKDIRSGTRNIVHGSRLKFFRNSEYEVTEECTDYLAFQEGEYCLVDEFEDIRLKDGELELLVKWKRFDDEQPAWKSFQIMREDVPTRVKEFLNELSEHGTKRQKQLVAKCNYYDPISVPRLGWWGTVMSCGGEPHV